MHRITERLGGLMAELKRRHLFRVVAAYAAAAFVVLQVAEVTFEPLGLPPVAMTVLVVAVIVGFPITVVLGWVFDITPSGIQRTPPTERSDEAVAVAVGGGHGRTAMVATGIILVVATGFGLAVGYMRPASAEADLRSIAVLPFENLSPDTAQAYFSDAMTEEILTALATIGELRVVSRTTVMGYKGTGKSARQIGRELGVGAILEGSVQRIGDRVRITAQLIDARTDGHLWATQYDRRIDDIFEIQSEIAGEIAGALRSELSGAERRQLAGGRTENLSAYDAYLQATQLLGSHRSTALERAIELLQTAVRLDPSFARAHAELGRALLQAAVVGGRSEPLDSAFASVQRALALDSTVAEAHEVLGALQLHRGQTQGALEAYDRAVRLRPGASALAGIAAALEQSGLYDQALAAYHQAAAREPLSAEHALSLGGVYARLGLYDVADRWARHALALQRDLWTAHLLHARIRLMAGDTAQAIRATRAMLDLAGDEPLALRAAGDLALATGALDSAEGYYRRLLAASPGGELAPTTPLAYIAEREGRPAEAGEHLRQSGERMLLLAWEFGGQPYRLHYESAQICAILADLACATRSLQEAVQQGFRDARRLAADPLFERIRSQPAFVTLLRTLRVEVDAMAARVTPAAPDSPTPARQASAG